MHIPYTGLINEVVFLQT